jgi:hypothetical protein
LQIPQGKIDYFSIYKYAILAFVYHKGRKKRLDLKNNVEWWFKKKKIKDDNQKMFFKFEYNINTLNSIRNKTYLTKKLRKKICLTLRILFIY